MNFKEPDCKSLPIVEEVELWKQYQCWSDRIELARTANPTRIGDILILAEEAPVTAWRAEAWIKAGIALAEVERYDFALEQLERGLAIDPHNLQGQQNKKICLQQLAKPKKSSLNLDRAYPLLSEPEGKWEPKQVFLFSGHMVDTAERNPPRFPQEKTAIAKEKLEAALLQMSASNEDLALTQGACGGDLLFTEACQKLGVEVQWLQPFNEPEFIERSVAPGGDNWRDRYYRAKEKLTMPIRSAPQSLGLPPPSWDKSYPYERCNLWLFYTALCYGTEKVKFICLWDGENSDSRGGTAHMYREVKHRRGQIEHINTKFL